MRYESRCANRENRSSDRGDGIELGLRNIDRDRGEFENLQTLGGGESTQALLDERDGPFVNYRVVKRYPNDGKQWVLLQHRVCDWCIEVYE